MHCNLIAFLRSAALLAVLSLLFCSIAQAVTKGANNLALSADERRFLEICGPRYYDLLIRERTVTDAMGQLWKRPCRNLLAPLVGRRLSMDPVRSQDEEPKSFFLQTIELSATGNVQPSLDDFLPIAWSTVTRLRIAKPLPIAFPTALELSKTLGSSLQELAIGLPLGVLDVVSLARLLGAYPNVHTLELAAENVIDEIVYTTLAAHAEQLRHVRLQFQKPTYLFVLKSFHRLVAGPPLETVEIRLQVRCGHHSIWSRLLLRKLQKEMERVESVDTVEADLSEFMTITSRTVCGVDGNTVASILLRVRLKENAFFFPSDRSIPEQYPELQFFTYCKDYYENVVLFRAVSYEILMDMGEQCKRILQSMVGTFVSTSLSEPFFIQNAVAETTTFLANEPWMLWSKVATVQGAMALQMLKKVEGSLELLQVLNLSAPLADSMSEELQALLKRTPALRYISIGRKNPGSAAAVEFMIAKYASESLETVLINVDAPSKLYILEAVKSLLQHKTLQKISFSVEEMVKRAGPHWRTAVQRAVREEPGVQRVILVPADVNGWHSMTIVLDPERPAHQDCGAVSRWQGCLRNIRKPRKRWLEDEEEEEEESEMELENEEEMDKMGEEHLSEMPGTPQDQQEIPLDRLKSLSPIRSRDAFFRKLGSPPARSPAKQASPSNLWQEFEYWARVEEEADFLLSDIMNPRKDFDGNVVQMAPMQVAADPPEQQEDEDWVTMFMDLE